MAGSGYHPEGHWWKIYTGSLGGGKFICLTCCEVAVRDPQDVLTECVDDY